MGMSVEELAKLDIADLKKALALKEKAAWYEKNQEEIKDNITLIQAARTAEELKKALEGTLKAFGLMEGKTRAKRGTATVKAADSETVLSIISSEQISAVDVAGKLGLEVKAVSATLKELVAENKIKQIGKARGTKYVLA